MKTFFTVKNSYRAASQRDAARIINIVILMLLWSVCGEAKVTEVAPADWAAYGQTATVSNNGDDVAVNVGDKTYTVKTARGLAWIAWVTNEVKTTANEGETHSAYYPATAGFKDCTVMLNGNISLAKPESDVAEGFKENWVPIGKDDYKRFKGTFKGNNHTISGMKIGGTVDFISIGFFGGLDEATVMDLTVGGEISLTGYNGTMFTISIGGIAGVVLNKTKIINCHNACKITGSGIEKNIRAGGIAGQIHNTLFVYASSNSAEINMTSLDGCYVGGIVGYLMSGSSIASCFNSGKINGSGKEAMIGGLAGFCQVKISNSYSTGEITGTSTTNGCYSGGIAGYTTTNTLIISCYATGLVSAHNNDNKSKAGGIAGYTNNATIQNCLALNEDGIKALGTADDKSAGRIIGQKNGNSSLADNYASTHIELTLGNGEPAPPTQDLTASGINGADIYLNEVAAAIASWAGTEDTKAFTVIGTDDDGKLPQLKTVNFNANGEPTGTYGDAIPNQPAASLATDDFLSALDPLVLFESNTDTYTISYPNNKWTYKKNNDDALIPFSGRILIEYDDTSSSSKLIIDNVIGNPTLTFDNVKMINSNGTPLTINEGCELTIDSDESVLELNSGAAHTLVNKGRLTLAGKGLYIYNTNNDYYGIENSGTLRISDQKTEIILRCNKEAIHNTGTLSNTWIEWQFAKPFNGIDYIATNAVDQTPKRKICDTKAYATTVTAGKTYRLWKMDNSDGEGLARLQGKESNGTSVVYFQAPAKNGLAVFTDMKVAVGANITQTVNGGFISIFCNDDLVAADDVIPDGAKLTCKYSTIPGYRLKSYTATLSGGVSGGPVDISSGSYTVPADATSVAFTVKFEKNAQAVITEEEVQETVPVDPVDAPTTVIPVDERPDIEGSSTIKLLTGNLEKIYKKDIDKAISNEKVKYDKLVYTEIALVEVKQDGTKIPLQPKAGSPITIIYPYPAGTDAGYTFTVVHLKSDGTTEVYSNANGLLRNTATGLKFSVSSFSPFGISWEVKSTPEPELYTVTLPAVEGAVTDPVAGSYEVESWSDFHFYLTPDKDYDQSVPVVTTSRGETIEPRNSDGVYIIKYVRTPVVVSITGIEKNTDVANSATLEAGLKLWTERSALCLETDRTEEIRIIAITGATVAVFDIQPGLTRRELSPGVYIVKTARSVCKVLVR